MYILCMYLYVVDLRHVGQARLIWGSSRPGYNSLSVFGKRFLFFKKAYECPCFVCFWGNFFSKKGYQCPCFVCFWETFLFFKKGYECPCNTLDVVGQAANVRQDAILLTRRYCCILVHPYLYCRNLRWTHEASLFGGGRKQEDSYFRDVARMRSFPMYSDLLVETKGIVV